MKILYVLFIRLPWELTKTALLMLGYIIVFMFAFFQFWDKMYEAQSKPSKYTGYR